MTKLRWCAFSRRRVQLSTVLSLMVTPLTPSYGAPDRAAAAAGQRTPPSDDSIRVTWDDVVRVVDRHPRMAAGLFQIEAARGSESAARAVPNPMLEGNVGQGTSRTDGLRRVEWGLGLTMPLSWLAQRGPRVDAARAEVDASVAESKALRRDVLLQLSTLFWSLAYEQSRVASLEELENETNALVTIIKTRVEKGESRLIEATRVEIELEKVTSELLAARTARKSKQAELALWLTAPANAKLAVEAELESLPAVITRDAAMARIRESHPSLALAKARMRLREAELRTEKAARVPSVAFSGFTAHELDRRAYGLGVAVDVPLWNWNSGRIAQAKARLGAERKQAEATALELGASVLEVQAACEETVVTATRFKNNLIPRAEIAASTMERTYQLGDTSLLEVIDARRTLLDARRAYLAALITAQIDCGRVRVLVGDESR